MPLEQKLNVGIPNRSSLLHVGAMTQCIAAGLIDETAYHPAKLFYSSSDTNVFLTSGQNLCTLLLAEQLDVIFTGDDYASEFLTPSVKKFPYPFLLSKLALLTSQKKLPQPIEKVFSKYPKTAAFFLENWNRSYCDIVPISGGCEAFSFLSDSFAVFDVVSTGITQVMNQLHIHNSTDFHSCSWFSYREELPPSLMKILDNKTLLRALKEIYTGMLHSRDAMPSALVRDTLNAIPKSD